MREAAEQTAKRRDGLEKSSAQAATATTAPANKEAQTMYYGTAGFIFLLYVVGFALVMRDRMRRKREEEES